MTAPYRESDVPVCPSCGGGIHTIETRLVCDRCGGMMLTADELVQSLFELDGKTEELAADDVKPDDAVCPRCRNPMESCTLRAGKQGKLDGRHLRCARDGVWIARDHLVAAFARASRRGGVGGGAPGGSRMPMSAVAQIGGGGGTAGAAMSSIQAAYAHSLPLVGQYRFPRVHTVFVSAFRGRDLACPACKDRPLACEGDRWACTACAGAFVENAALVAMASDIARAPWELPAPTGHAGERLCPVCQQAMLVEPLGPPTIDRCVEHGIWFDHDELGVALEHAGDPPKSTAGWLRKLFHRGA